MSAMNARHAMLGVGRVAGRREGGCSIIQGRQPQEVSAAATRSASPALLFCPTNLTAAPSHTYLLLTYYLIQVFFHSESTDKLIWAVLGVSRTSSWIHLS